MKKFSGLLLLLLCVGCAQGAQIPGWVVSEPADYPPERYLNGRGQGETLGLARDRARVDLAKIFEVALSESSRDHLQWQQGQAGENGLKTSISRDVQAQTSQVIKGVQISRTWRGEAGGDFHALAVLDRLQAGNRLRAEINTLDRETAENIGRARRDEPLPEKISAAYNALNAQLKRQHPQKMLQIVDLSGVGLPAKYRLAELKSDFESLLDRWQVGLRVAQDELGGVERLLAGGLANAGIRHLASESAAEYLLQAAIDSEKFRSADGWNWVRGTLRISLLETASGNIIGSHQWSYKSAARQAEMAEIRARDNLADFVAQQLLEVLVEFGDVAQKKSH